MGLIVVGVGIVAAVAAVGMVAVSVEMSAIPSVAPPTAFLSASVPSVPSEVEVPASSFRAHILGVSPPLPPRPPPLHHLLLPHLPPRLLLLLPHLLLHLPPTLLPLTLPPARREDVALRRFPPLRLRLHRHNTPLLDSLPIGWRAL